MASAALTPVVAEKVKFLELPSFHSNIHSHVLRVRISCSAVSSSKCVCHFITPCGSKC